MHSTLLKSVPGIIHAFGTKPQPCPIEFEEYKTTSSFLWKQVHGTHIEPLNSKEHNPGNADGFFTKTPKIPLKVISADCNPILLARKDGGAVAAIHAGWKGTLNKIVEKFWQDFGSQENASHWVAAIGPSIGSCCYEIGEDLISSFQKEFPQHDHDIFIPEKRRIDLQKLNELELRRIGFEQIDLINNCTYCSTDPTFFSYRKRTKLKLDEGKLCQWSVIMKTN